MEPMIMLVVCIYILYLVNRKAFMFVYLMWYFLSLKKLELMMSLGIHKHSLV